MSWLERFDMDALPRRRGDGAASMIEAEEGAPAPIVSGQPLQRGRLDDRGGGVLRDASLGVDFAGFNGAASMIEAEAFGS